MTDLEPLMTPEDLCQLLGVSYSTLMRRIKTGRVPAWEPRGRHEGYRWQREKVRSWFSNRPRLRAVGA